MDKQKFFQTHILPYLEDIINWKVILFLNEGTVSKLATLGLIKEREPTDRLVDDFIIYDEYKIRLHHHFKFISKVQKGDNILYEYDEQTACKKKPKMMNIYIHFFETHILSYLEDMINGKSLLYFDIRTVNVLQEVRCIRPLEQVGEDWFGIIICGNYEIQFQYYIRLVTKIQKDDTVLYEYNDKTAALHNPNRVYFDDPFI